MQFINTLLTFVNGDTTAVANLEAEIKNAEANQADAIVIEALEHDKQATQQRLSTVKYGKIAGLAILPLLALSATASVFTTSQVVATVDATEASIVPAQEEVDLIFDPRVGEYANPQYLSKADLAEIKAWQEPSAKPASNPYLTASLNVSKRQAIRALKARNRSAYEVIPQEFAQAEKDYARVNQRQLTQAITELYSSQQRYRPVSQTVGAFCARGNSFATKYESGLHAKYGRAVADMAIASYSLGVKEYGAKTQCPGRSADVFQDVVETLPL